MSGLHILQDLLSKNAPAFEDQFARLGLQQKIHSLAGPPADPVEEMEVMEEGQEGEKEKEGEEMVDGEIGKESRVDLEDATDLAVFIPYQWREWSIVRSQDCLYMWNEFSSLELSNVSNGWFRFLIDNKLATMYSSGSTEGGPDSFGEMKCLHSHAVLEKKCCLYCKKNGPFDVEPTDYRSLSTKKTPVTTRHLPPFS